MLLGQLQETAILTVRLKWGAQTDYGGGPRNRERKAQDESVLLQKPREQEC